MEAELARVLDAGARRVVVDLALVEYMSSAGLRVLLSAMKRLKAREGRMALAGLQPPVLEVFNLTGFSRIFSMGATRDEAVRLMQE
jgi:anti-anti-sigma factor